MVQTRSIARRLASQQPALDGLPSSLGNPSSSHAVGPDLPFNFLALPAEIRFIVYKIMFVGRTARCAPIMRRMQTDQAPTPSSERAYKIPPCPWLSYHYFNLLQTCRHVNDEATYVLYGLNMFMFEKEKPTNTRDLWSERALAGIGAHNCQRLRHVHFCFVTSHSTAVINDLNSYWQSTLAILWASCRLSTLIISLAYWRSSTCHYFLQFAYIFKYFYNGVAWRLVYDEHGRAIEPPRGMDLRSLKQLKLELSASVKAFAISHYLESPEGNEDPV
ncbi:MAG: hypothetical protein Q9198_003710 [Flavoplaca austrocitrina]